MSRYIAYSLLLLNLVGIQLLRRSRQRKSLG
jgi:hypothetical protein